MKRAAASGERIRGVHLTFSATQIIEILASVGLDFVYLDCEHGMFGPKDVEACCLAAERHGISVIARVPDRSEAAITSYLDRGVRGLVVPHVNSVADARAVIEAACYAPLGQRSFGSGRPHYGLNIADQAAHLAECNADLSICVMIESRGGFDAAGEIAALEGVDYLSFGLNDLSQAMGYPGQPGGAEVKKAVEVATEAIHGAGLRVREDFMRFAWINELIVAGARQLVG